MWYCYHILSKEVLMQTENDNDLYGGQRSSEFKCGKLQYICDMATIFGQKICWCKLKMIMTFMEVKGHQKSNITCAMATIFGQKNCWCKLRMMMMTFTEVKGHQRSNEVNYASKLDANLGWLTFMEVKGKQRSNTVNNICQCGTTMILDVCTETGYTSFLGCIHPVSWGNPHGCTLMALLNWYQLVFASGLTRPDAYIYLELAMITAVEMWIDDGATQWAKFSISAVT